MITRTHVYGQLAGKDPVLASIINIYGTPDPFRWPDGGRTGSSQFAAMALHIVGQQISAAAAFTIYDRITTAAGSPVPTPESILALGSAALRRCGLSGAKAGYVTALAYAQLNEGLDIEHLDDVADDDVLARLTAIRGIGLWSAQTFLLHNLKRADVLPEADIGIRQAIRRLWNLDGVPSPRAVRVRGESWAPYRSYAAALLWRSNAPADELSDPKERALNRRAVSGRVGAASH